MADAVILETTFLIDLERETRSEPGSAWRYLEEHQDQRMLITSVIAGELAAGVSLSDRANWLAFVRRFRILVSDEEVAWQYGLSYRYLKSNGLLIGANDLWIAAAGIAHEVPVLTRNTDHFRRVPRLEVLSY